MSAMPESKYSNVTVKIAILILLDMETYVIKYWKYISPLILTWYEEKY